MSTVSRVIMMTNKVLRPDNPLLNDSNLVDAQRLAALHELNLPDTPHEECFDRIVRTAARLFDVPLSAIRLIAADREWTKASTSGQQAPLPPEASFCSDAIIEHHALIVSDTRDDPRFVNNPYVVGVPYIRFYAGRPLAASDGTPIGTLCIMDFQPRAFSEADMQALDDLASWAENEINAASQHQASDDLRDIHQAMQQTHDQALQATRLKSEFLAMMSHEIRTPMSAIISLTEMLLETPPALSNTQCEMLHTIQHSGTLLMRLINDILDFSKIEANKLTLEAIDFDPAVLIKEVATLLSARAQSKQLTLKFQVDPDLPASVRGDPTRLRQVLLNLVDNAVKFTDQGSVMLCVSLEAITEGGVTLRFGVKDTGIGLSDAARARLFQPFTQADSTTTRKYGGTGPRPQHL